MLDWTGHTACSIPYGPARSAYEAPRSGRADSLPIPAFLMQEFQRWLLTTLRSILGWLSSQWDTVMRGISHEWPVAYFILGMGVLLVVGLTTIWRRGSIR